MVSCRGHATSDPTVCAAISALIISFENYCRKHEDVIKMHDAQIESGDCYVRCCGDDKTRAVFECITDGLRALVKAYPMEAELA